MKDDLIYVGYRTFMSKSGNKCNVLDFITKPKKTKNGDGVYVSNISVFTEEEKYFDFIKKNQLLSTVSVSFEIIGDKVRYNI